MNQASSVGENWSELGRRRRYMVATIRTPLRRINIHTVETAIIRKCRRPQEFYQPSLSKGSKIFLAWWRSGEFMTIVLVSTPNFKPTIIKPLLHGCSYRPTELDNFRPVRRHWELTSSNIHWVTKLLNYSSVLYFNTKIVLDQSNHSAELDNIEIFILRERNIFSFIVPDHHRQCLSHTLHPGVF